jgi:hypothetical protein
MRALHAQLSRHEEAALRKIGFGNKDRLEPAHLRRFLYLDLIDWTGHEWRLTRLGQQRYALLIVDAGRPSAA